MKKFIILLCLLSIAGFGQTEQRINLIKNGDFADPTITNSKGWQLYEKQLYEREYGWKTTWDYFEVQSDVLGIEGAEGRKQYAEINAHGTVPTISAISQVIHHEGNYVHWTFWHRGRGGEDTVRLTIGNQVIGDYIAGTEWVFREGYYTPEIGELSAVMSFECVKSAKSSPTVGCLMSGVTAYRLNGDTLAGLGGSNTLYQTFKSYRTRTKDGKKRIDYNKGTFLFEEPDNYKNDVWNADQKSLFDRVKKHYKENPTWFHAEMTMNPRSGEMLFTGFPFGDLRTTFVTAAGRVAVTINWKVIVEKEWESAGKALALMEHQFGKAQFGYRIKYKYRVIATYEIEGLTSGNIYKSDWKEDNVSKWLVHDYPSNVRYDEGDKIVRNFYFFNLKEEFVPNHKEKKKLYTPVRYERIAKGKKNRDLPPRPIAILPRKINAKKQVIHNSWKKKNITKIKFKSETYQLAIADRYIVILLDSLIEKIKEQELAEKRPKGVPVVTWNRLKRAFKIKKEEFIEVLEDAENREEHIRILKKYVVDKVLEKVKLNANEAELKTKQDVYINEETGAILINHRTKNALAISTIHVKANELLKLLPFLGTAIEALEKFIKVSNNILAALQFPKVGYRIAGIEWSEWDFLTSKGHWKTLVQLKPLISQDMRDKGDILSVRTEIKNRLMFVGYNVFHDYFNGTTIDALNQKDEANTPRWYDRNKSKRDKEKDKKKKKKISRVTWKTGDLFNGFPKDIRNVAHPHKRHSENILLADDVQKAGK